MYIIYRKLLIGLILDRHEISGAAVHFRVRKCYWSVFLKNRKLAHLRIKKINETFHAGRKLYL